MTVGTIKLPLKNKLTILMLVAIVPLIIIITCIIISTLNYSNSYDAIVSNMTTANEYNLYFKENMDESIYKLVVGAVTFENIEESDTLQNPYDMIDELKKEGEFLWNSTPDQESRVHLQSLMRNLDTLTDRLNDLRISIEKGGQYDINIEMLDNNIYILTDLVQDNIQNYIFYQAKSIEQLKEQLNDQLQSFVIFSILITFSILVMEVLIMVTVLRSILNPVYQLCQVTSQIAEGDFSKKAAIETDDELSILSDSIDNMSEHLEIMMHQIKEDERKMRYAELRLLQEQINPHFLYNTLDTIVWLIEGNDADKAVDMVVSLSEFFRLVLSKGKEYITIRDEELHLQNYLQIQKARYRDILEYDIQLDEELYQYKILKLTLQPIVENALYHGIKYKRAKGMIKVRGYMEQGRIHLTISDNGVGMDVEELESLREKITRPCKETDAGFGLANVNERIRMNFGMEYGMQIDSKKNEGTIVHILIPAERFCDAK